MLIAYNNLETKGVRIGLKKSTTKLNITFKAKLNQMKSLFLI